MPRTLPLIHGSAWKSRIELHLGLTVIGSAVQCTAVKADKSFLQSREKWLPTEWTEDTGCDKEFNVCWPVFGLYWNCGGACG